MVQYILRGVLALCDFQSGDCLMTLGKVCLHRINGWCTVEPLYLIWTPLEPTCGTVLRSVLISEVVSYSSQEQQAKS